MIEFNNLSIFLIENDRPLITNFDFVLKRTDKIAIIGEEGNGKSTLLKAIINPEEVKKYAVVKGKIETNNYKLGYLEQILESYWNYTKVIEYLLKDKQNVEIDYDNYNKIGLIKSLFNEFKLNDDLLDQEIMTLSGGEKVKVQLIKILINEPDVLLLDEPTNDLDLNTLKWLENFINSSKLPILFISHDETLLENTANGIIHLEQIRRKTISRHTIERIPYQSYIEKRFNLLERQNTIARKQQANYDKKITKFREIYEKVEHEQNVITRSDPFTAAALKRKINSLKSQEKRFEKEKEGFEEIPDVEESINLFFDKSISIPNGKMIINNLVIDELKIDNKILSKNINISIKGPEHIVIIGKNGVGKTTLLKKIIDSINDTSLKIGYMPQNYDDLLKLNLNAVEYLSIDKSRDQITKVRTLLGSLKFTKEEMENKILTLSGGQKAKILLLNLVINNCNVLVLDEPTRNLSPLSNPVIRKILVNYPGAIISISHDRKYIKEVSDKIYELNENGLEEINHI